MRAPAAAALALALALAPAGAARAQEGGGETLPEALAEILAAEPGLAAARARARAAAQGLSSARSIARPSASASLSAAARRVEARRPERGEETTRPRSAALSFSQPIPAPGLLDARERRARALVDAALADYRAAEQGVLLSGALAYAALWRDRETRGLLVEDEALAAEELRIVSRRVSLGEATRTDRALAQARLAAARAGRAAADGDLARSEADLERLLGRAPGPLEAPRAPDASPGADREAALARARAGHPSLEAAARRLAAADAALEEVRGGLAPVFEFTGSLSTSADAAGGDASTAAQVGIGARVPILVAGQVSDAWEERLAERRALRHDGDLARRGVEREVALAWSARAASEARIGALEASERAARAALEAVREENRLGARPLNDLLQAQRDLLAARVSLAAARHDRVAAGWSLLASVGGLSPGGVGLPGEAPDPAEGLEEALEGWADPRVLRRLPPEEGGGAP